MSWVEISDKVFPFARCQADALHDDEEKAFVREGALLVQGSRRHHFTDASLDVLVYALGGLVSQMKEDAGALSSLQVDDRAFQPPNAEAQSCSPLASPSRHR